MRSRQPRRVLVVPGLTRAERLTVEVLEAGVAVQLAADGVAVARLPLPPKVVRGLAEALLVAAAHLEGE